MGVALSGCGEQMLMTNQNFLYERQLAVPVTSSLFFNFWCTKSERRGQVHCIALPREVYGPVRACWYNFAFRFVDTKQIVKSAIACLNPFCARAHKSNSDTSVP